MSWVTAIWAAVMGACLAIALPYLFIAVRQRRPVHLIFSTAIVSTMAIAAAELMMMRAGSIQQIGKVQQWAHLPIFILVVTIVAFVRLHFGTGRLWLGLAACVVRFACLIINFLVPPNLNFREITALGHLHFLGDTVSVPVGVVSPWIHLAELSSLLLLAFVVDASIGLWRRGNPENRRRALMVGGSITVFILVAAGWAAMIHLKIIHAPYLVSLPFGAVIVAMAFELSYDMFSALQVARKLQLSEAARRESEARFRIVADSAPVLIWMAGPDKLCVFFNKGWLDFTGRTMEQELGNGWSQGVHPDDLDECLKTYVAAFEARQPFVMQYRLRRYDGEYRWIKDDGVPRYDVQKNFAGYIGSCVDINDWITKEQALRKSEERMSLAVEAANLGLWEWDLSTNEMWGTKTRLALLGLSASEKITIEDVLALTHVDDRDRLRQAMNDVVRTGKDYNFEYRVIFPDGSVRWMEQRGRCVSGVDGKTIALRGVSMDVTERKQAQEQFQLATEALPSGIIIVNDRGDIVLVNLHIEELFGYHRDELVGKPVEALIPERLVAEHPAHRAKFLSAPQARAMGAGRELFARRKDGTEFPVEIGLSPIPTPQGILVLASVVDISARKAAEAEARRRREQINLLTRVSLLGEMTASIAHELNQPLSAIVSNANAGMRFIAKGNVDPGTLREILVDVVSDGHRAHDIIRAVRNTVKKGGTVRQQINLNDTIVKVVHMVQPDAGAHSCELKISLAKNLPTVEGDPVQIQQVLINFINNAFDAMRETPSNKRSVEILTEQNGDGTICVSVRDHGGGIPDEARGRLFEQFFTTKKEGLGMGLAIVRSIIEAHGGKIGAENVDGGGARFYVILPTSKDPVQ